MEKDLRKEKAQEDIKLIEKALGNSQRAYERLMERYYDSIYFMILRLVNNMTDAEELTQETFAKVFRNLKKYNPKYPFSSWLFSIATNISIDFLRKRKEVEVSIDANDEYAEFYIPESGTLNPEEHFIQKQRVKALRNKVEALREQYRILIELRYFEEYTYEEISEELSLPMGTVKTQLHRAKAQLLKSMKGK